jgi:two-component system response regulator DesR
VTNVPDDCAPREPIFAPGLRPAGGTVRNYLSSAMRKLDARTRAEAVRTAEEKGWL